VLRIKLENDQDPTSPADRDWGCEWKFVSFCKNHVHDGDREEYFTEHCTEVEVGGRWGNQYNTHYTPTCIGLRRKLKVGTAFTLTYQEHGQCNWSVGSEDSPDGVLIWDGDLKDLSAKTYQERLSWARAWCEEYTDWCNGNCYYFDIRRINKCPHCEEEDHGSEEELECCGGFIGDKYMFEEIRGITNRYPDDDIEVTGEASWLADHHKLRDEKPKEKVIRPHGFSRSRVGPTGKLTADTSLPHRKSWMAKKTKPVKKKAATKKTAKKKPVKKAKAAASPKPTEAPTKKKKATKKKTAVVCKGDGEASLPDAGTPESSAPKKKKKAAPAEGSLAAEAAKARDRLKRPTRNSSDGYGEDDLPDRSQRRPAEYEPRTDPRRSPRRAAFKDIIERRYYTMIGQVTNKRCQAHLELEALRDNFRGDTVKRYRKIVELWLRIYGEACEHEHALMKIITEEFPNFKPPPMVLNWPHIVSTPPNMEHAIESIHGDEYVDGKWVTPKEEKDEADVPGAED